MNSADLQHMRLAIEQARKGQGRTSPNPCVGAVVVRDDQVLGMGHHRRAGEAHAEINAIAAAGGPDACVGATLYVTLEPCNHHGRTPPCSQAVLAAGFRRVVVGMADPNPVAAGGAELLRSRGVAVEVGLLEQECRQLNHPFLKHSATGLPWVAMKAGMSLDGRISRIRGQGGSITGPESQRRTHELRNELDAILIGIGTALTDNPSLTARLEGSRDPLRAVLDSRLRLPPDARLLCQPSTAQTWIFCSRQASLERQTLLEQAGAIVHRIDAGEEGVELRQVLLLLGKANVASVLVEGGAAVHGAFLRAGLVDQVFLFAAPCFIGEGGTPLIAGNGSSTTLVDTSVEMLGQDIFLQGMVRREQELPS